MAKEKALFNKGPNTFKTSKGLFKPGDDDTFPEAEAAGLLQYPTIIEFGKLPKPSNKEADLQAALDKAIGERDLANEQVKSLSEENGKLKDENVELAQKLQEAIEAGKKKKGDKE